jgi:hypothetical protein
MCLRTCLHSPALPSVQAVAQKEGNTTLPDAFDLVVVTMLNNLKESEAKELAAEEAFFKSLPSPTGQPGAGSKLVHWPIVGDIVSPHASITKKACLTAAAQYDTRPDHMVRACMRTSVGMQFLMTHAVAASFPPDSTQALGRKPVPTAGCRIA